VILSFLFLLFIAMFMVLGYNLGNIAKDKTNQRLNEIKGIVMDEVRLAGTLQNGYKRQFQIPREIDGKALTLSVENDTFLYLKLGDEPASDGLPYYAVGGFCFGTQTGPYYNLSVTREGDIVSLSSCFNCSITYASCTNAEKMGMCDAIEGLEPGYKKTCCNGYGKCCVGPSPC
jgi:hypothetical protein